MASDEKAGCSGLILLLLVLCCMGGLWSILAGHRTELAKPYVRIFALLGMFALAWFYQELSELKLGVVAGLIEIGASLVGNWITLSKFVQQASPDQLFNRIALLVGGIYVLVHGIKTFRKGLEYFDDAKGGKHRP